MFFKCLKDKLQKKSTKLLVICQTQLYLYVRVTILLEKLLFDSFSDCQI